ncbi:hypothetical protein ACSFU8_001766 [Escherichia coli]|nr:hypothetical protein [Escherichia coli]EHL9256528.1 hypothetical protein [Escherichia coli]ELN4752691.1 hypothetical protein [Escherichia coli]
MKQEIILKYGNEELTLSEDVIIATAYALGITPTELKKQCERLYKVESNKPSHQDLINAKAEQLKLTIKGNK